MQGGQPPVQGHPQEHPLPIGTPHRRAAAGAFCCLLDAEESTPAGAVQSWGLAYWGGGSQLGSPQAQCGSEEEQSTEMQLLHRFIV